MTTFQWQTLCTLIEEELKSKTSANFTVCDIKRRLNIEGDLKSELGEYITEPYCKYQVKFAYNNKELSFRKKEDNKLN